MAAAVRIAQAATERDIVLFCRYHGWHDWYLAAQNYSRHEGKADNAMVTYNVNDFLMPGDGGTYYTNPPFVNDNQVVSPGEVVVLMAFNHWLTPAGASTMYPQLGSVENR